MCHWSSRAQPDLEIASPQNARELHQSKPFLSSLSYQSAKEQLTHAFTRTISQNQSFKKARPYPTPSHGISDGLALHRARAALLVLHFSQRRGRGFCPTPWRRRRRRSASLLPPHATALRSPCKNRRRTLGSARKWRKCWKVREADWKRLKA